MNKKKKQAVKRHDEFRKRKLNLVSIFDKFNDLEKEAMLKAWSHYYNPISLGMLPFTNRTKMKVAVNDFYFDLSKMTSDDVLLEQNIIKKLRS